MDELIEKSDLDLSSWFINWGLMRGYLREGKIVTTKFGLYSQWLCISMNLFDTIKWSILLFYPKESKLSNELGDWGYFIGPKIFLDLMIVFITTFALTSISLFYFWSKSSNSKSMFYWLECMEYDRDNRCFNKLNLNESESEMMIKRMALFNLALKAFIYLGIPFFVAATIFAVFKLKIDSNYQLNYIISILLYTIQGYYNACYLFGFLMVLYLVIN